ncbi:MAG: CarD family transcriptional regulator [Desulfovibrio sp.]|nr:CarD family transcriptional regulator [Desulfovibrio sp.]
MFTPNELVVYPAQGVGKIERIDSQHINGVPCSFYIVRIRANNITLMVPVDNALKVGLRPLVPSQRAIGMLDSLRNDTDKIVYTGQNWNRRFREYSDRLKSPDLLVVTEVLRELLLIGKTKELSFGERRLQEQAMSLVTGELAEVLNTTEDALRSELFEIYVQFCRQKAWPLTDGDSAADQSV